VGPGCQREMGDIRCWERGGHAGPVCQWRKARVRLERGGWAGLRENWAAVLGFAGIEGKMS